MVSYTELPGRSLVRSQELSLPKINGRMERVPTESKSDRSICVTARCVDNIPNALHWYC
jgi:hypothetical protein